MPSTTPESAIAALNALGDRVTTMILGGQDRGNDFTELGKRIASSQVKTIILFPGSGPRIKKAIIDAKANVAFMEADSMEKAVSATIEKTSKQANKQTALSYYFQLHHLVMECSPISRRKVTFLSDL